MITGSDFDMLDYAALIEPTERERADIRRGNSWKLKGRQYGALLLRKGSLIARLSTRVTPVSYTHLTLPTILLV